MKMAFSLALLLGLLTAGAASAGSPPAVDRLLQQYQHAGAGPFSADRGRRLWHETGRSVDGRERRCTTCHTTDLRARGKHVRTGKPIAPMAPSANPKRLQKAKTIEKWFRRNCKWTLGRPCTPQEKGDILRYLESQ